jgi:hypothetical protein
MNNDFNLLIDMKIIINDQQNIAQIQQAFNQTFPYLKLKFFSKTHPPERPSNPKFMIRADLKLGEFRKIHHSGEILITPQMSVNELEQCFGTEYGLGIQVFRKSGRAWLETIYTDTWTLAEQNTEGETLSQGAEPDVPEYNQDRD